ncbi:MAG: hypothetical protein FJW30_18780 [Acidobacteria bacterium]|nr:hypothetical protein [Acidobacteriota bacterium]
MCKRLLVFVIVGAAVLAQAPAPKPLKLGSVTVSGSLRARGEAFDWFTPDSGDPSYLYSGNIFRISFSAKKENWDWNAEFAVPFLLGLPNNALAPGAQGALGLGGNYFAANQRNRNAAMIFPKQLFVRYGGATGHSIRAGRFEFMDGGELTPKNAALAVIKNTRVNMRLLGHFAWTDVGRSFDGAHYSFTNAKGNFTLLAATPTRGVFQVDGWGWNKTAFGYGSYTKPWGKGTHAAETRVLALVYDDFRDVLKTDNRPLAVRRGDAANIRIGTFGGQTLHAFTTKRAVFDLLVWGAAQTGKWGALDQRAVSLDVETGVQPAMWKKLKPWFRGGYFAGSGDKNPNDGTHGTFFQVLPTPRPFARFPFFNMMNNRDAFGMLTLRPHAKVTISNEFHALRLSNSNDLWYQGGGVFQPWTFGYIGRATNGRRSLANLYDANIEYRMNPRVTLLGYAGYAQGLASTASIYPKGRNSAFGYVEALYRF